MKVITVITTGIMLIIFSVLIGAEDFKSTAAKAAQQKYESTIAKAKADYLKELNAALTAAMKTGDLDEANKIKAAIDGKSEKKEEVEIEVEKVTPEKVETKLQKANRLAIIGTWKQGMATITFNEDGTCTDILKGISGTWEITSELGDFKVQWLNEFGRIRYYAKPINGMIRDPFGLMIKEKTIK